MTKLKTKPKNHSEPIKTDHMLESAIQELKFENIQVRNKKTGEIVEFNVSDVGSGYKYYENIKSITSSIHLTNKEFNEIYQVVEKSYTEKYNLGELKTKPKNHSEPIKTDHMLESANRELHFANLQVQHLMSVLDELHSFSGIIERKVIDNAKERHELDKLIHAKLLLS